MENNTNSIIKDLPDAVLVDCAYEAARRGLIEPLRLALLCPDVIAAKVWIRSDIASCLEEKGYKPSDANVSAVLETGDVDDALEDCTDGDWEIIYQAIEQAAACGQLEKEDANESD